MSENVTKILIKDKNINKTKSVVLNPEKISKISSSNVKVNTARKKLKRLGNLTSPSRSSKTPSSRHVGMTTRASCMSEDKGYESNGKGGSSSPSRADPTIIQGRKRSRRTIKKKNSKDSNEHFVGENCASSSKPLCSGKSSASQIKMRNRNVEGINTEKYNEPVVVHTTNQLKNIESSTEQFSGSFSHPSTINSECNRYFKNKNNTLNVLGNKDSEFTKPLVKESAKSISTSVPTSTKLPSNNPIHETFVRPTRPKYSLRTSTRRVNNCSNHGNNISNSIYGIYNTSNINDTIFDEYSFKENEINTQRFKTSNSKNFNKSSCLHSLKKKDCKISNSCDRERLVCFSGMNNCKSVESIKLVNVPTEADIGSISNNSKNISETSNVLENEDSEFAEPFLNELAKSILPSKKVSKESIPDPPCTKLLSNNPIDCTFVYPTRCRYPLRSSKRNKVDIGSISNESKASNVLENKGSDFDKPFENKVAKSVLPTKKLSEESVPDASCTKLLSNNPIDCTFIHPTRCKYPLRSSKRNKVDIGSISNESKTSNVLENKDSDMVEPFENKLAKSVLPSKKLSKESVPDPSCTKLLSNNPIDRTFVHPTRCKYPLRSSKRNTHNFSYSVHHISHSIYGIYDTSNINDTIFGNSTSSYSNYENSLKNNMKLKNKYVDKASKVSASSQNNSIISLKNVQSYERSEGFSGFENHKTVENLMTLVDDHVAANAKVNDTIIVDSTTSCRSIDISEGSNSSRQPVSSCLSKNISNVSNHSIKSVSSCGAKETLKVSCGARKTSRVSNTPSKSADLCGATKTLKVSNTSSEPAPLCGAEDISHSSNESEYLWKPMDASSSSEDVSGELKVVSNVPPDDVENPISQSKIVDNFSIVFKDVSCKMGDESKVVSTDNLEDSTNNESQSSRFKRQKSSIIHRDRSNFFDESSDDSNDSFTSRNDILNDESTQPTVPKKSGKRKSFFLSNDSSSSSDLSNLIQKPISGYKVSFKNYFDTPLHVSESNSVSAVNFHLNSYARKIEEETSNVLNSLYSDYDDGSGYF